jgi:hypothetical protein
MRQDGILSGAYERRGIFNPPSSFSRPICDLLSTQKIEKSTIKQKAKKNINFGVHFHEETQSANIKRISNAKMRGKLPKLFSFVSGFGL